MNFTLTLLGAVLAFVLGQIVIRFVVDPFHEYRTLVGKIAHALLFYANAFDVPGTRTATTPDEAQHELRSLAGQLFERTYAIPWYGLFSRLGLVPPREDITKASVELVGMSNSLGDHQSRGNYDRRERIRFLLRIR